ncbi:MAG: DUF2723 domain-containing protein [Deltaproteobacteria bacterium]|nr:DUF2723 domain-containing protein [Deltaproteobacteria bacterium]
MQRKNLFGHIDIFAVLAVTVPLFVYLLTLAPSVTFFDSGEFLAAVSSLGSPHSPGYPLFVNYAKPFTWLPFGNIAFRVNFATALSASLACLGVYLLAVRLMVEAGPDQGDRFKQFLRRSSALAAALAFAFTPRLWLQSNHDKPYPLLAFIAALIFLLLLAWRAEYRRGEERPGYVYLGAFLCGLAMGAHQTIVLFIPAIAVLILLTDWRLIQRVKEQVLALAFFFVGFAVYLHQPIRATRDPLMNWGDTDTLSRFLWHFLRKGYPMEHVDRDLALLLKQLAAFNLMHEFTAVGFFLLLVGAVAFRRPCRDFIIAFGVAVLVFLAFIVGYQNTPEETIFLTEEFFTPLYMLAAVFIGLGLFALSDSLVEVVTRYFGGKEHSVGGNWPGGSPVSVALLPVLLILLVSLPALQCAANYQRNDQRNNYLAFDYAVNTFRSLPPGAALFTWGDSGAFPLWYLQGVERLREDLHLLHVPHLQFEWYLDTFPMLFQASILRQVPAASLPLGEVLQLAMKEQSAQRPVFIDFSTRYSVDLEGLVLRQRGISYEVTAGARGTPLPPDRAVWDLYSLRGVHSGDLPFLDLDSVKAVRIYAYSRLESGETFLSLGRDREGGAELRMAERIDPGLRNEARRILHEHGARK